MYIDIYKRIGHYIGVYTFSEIEWRQNAVLQAHDQGARNAPCTGDKWIELPEDRAGRKKRSDGGKKCLDAGNTSPT